jgi:hypothetical protein
MGADRSALESARIIADRIADDFAMTQATNPRTTSIEAAVLRRLLQHLMDERPDVQNIDLMILAGFCRNCLSDWYREAAEAQGIAMSRDEAREAIYGRPFAQWKAAHQREATPEQLAAFAAARQPPNQ